MDETWEVVAGRDSGGLVVRESADLSSKQHEERLSYGAVVKELDILHGRLRFELLTGTGPQTGWVSLKVVNKDLLRRVTKTEEELIDPEMAWKSSGKTSLEGRHDSVDARPLAYRKFLAFTGQGSLYGAKGSGGYLDKAEKVPGMYQEAPPLTMTDWFEERASSKVDMRQMRDDLLRAMTKEKVYPTDTACSETSAPSRDHEPLFCAWYSGGFSPKDGEKLLAPLLEAVQQVGLETATFHFPDAYEMSGRGRGPWASYVDLLVREINQVAGSASRPLVLFGHSRGAAPATTVAYRLGQRVKKVYIAACGAMRVGEPTGWETLSSHFQEGGDRDLLKWFASLQPENVLLHRTAWETSDAEFEEQIESSKFLSDMLNVMRTQYRDAMFPDPDRDFGEFQAPIMAISPSQDENSQTVHMQDWGLLTSAGFELESVDAGHMDCLQPKPVSVEVPPVHEMQPPCPLRSPPDAEWKRTVHNFMKVQALQSAKGRCELFELICQDLRQLL
eukprot:gb/GFBE01047063.1/.p1 GENE.gb/GFBE01047063.1/~~gb/GFBE01047063.1/.p1  ORF type:complete len:503 (+),score=104.18 gb/GFBE01047063.1/:1-1509(+)